MSALSLSFWYLFGPKSKLKSKGERNLILIFTVKLLFTIKYFDPKLF